jgi:hypothetical protein
LSVAKLKRSVFAHLVLLARELEAC